MPSLPNTWTTINVFATYMHSDGSPASGSVLFDMPSVLILSSNTIVYKRTLVASLDSNGTIGIDLPATNDPDVVPTDWTYAVTELIGDNRPRMYNIKVDYQGPPIDLAVVAPVTPPRAGGCAGCRSAPPTRSRRVSRRRHRARRSA